MILRKFLSKSTFLQRQKDFVNFFCQSFQMYQNFRPFIPLILTYWYWKSVYPFKSCDGFFKDLRNWRFCGKFWVSWLFLQREKDFVKNFCQRYQIYQNFRAFILLILTYWYWKPGDPFKSCDGFFKDLRNRRFLS